MTHSVDFLLPVKLDDDWCGVVYRKNDASMCLLDVHDITNKALLCDPSFDVNSMNWFKCSVERIVVKHDVPRLRSDSANLSDDEESSQPTNQMMNQNGAVFNNQMNGMNGNCAQNFARLQQRQMQQQQQQIQFQQQHERQQQYQQQWGVNGGHSVATPVAHTQFQWDIASTAWVLRYSNAYFEQNQPQRTQLVPLNEHFKFSFFSLQWVRWIAFYHFTILSEGLNQWLDHILLLVLDVERTKLHWVQILDALQSSPYIHPVGLWPIATDSPSGSNRIGRMSRIDFFETKWIFFSSICFIDLFWNNCFQCLCL